MMRPGAKVKSLPVSQAGGRQKSVGGLSVLVELDIKAAVFDPVLFVFLNRVKIPYWVRDGFCLESAAKSTLFPQSSCAGALRCTSARTNLPITDHYHALGSGHLDR